MPDSAENVSGLKAARIGAILSAFSTPCLLVLCVRRWGQPEPWAWLNLFSGSFIALASLTYIEQSLTFLRTALRSRATLRDAVGATFDPALVNASMAMGFVDYAILLEYAHLRLVPALEQRALQWIGLFCAAGSLAMIFWADRWLSRHFARDESSRTLMTDGPYRFVRHPRYVSLVLAKLASPLLLGSVLAWIALPIWLVLVLHRIPLEEAHLRKAYGRAYDDYASRTARLLPGVY